jgi:hypothetical protein
MTLAKDVNLEEVREIMGDGKKCEMGRNGIKKREMGGEAIS